MKMFAGRDTDYRDVRSIVVRQDARGLDWPYIEARLAELSDVKDDLALLARLREIRNSAEAP